MKLPWMVLVGVLCIVGGFHASLANSYFCGYDDFADLNQTAFRDARQPSDMITKTHFGTPKYRPLHRVLTYVTWHYGGHAAAAFRLRNLAFHLLGVAALFGIAWLTAGGSVRVAATASLLFGLHPLGNQSLVAAIWTITPAYGIFLSALACFLLSWRRQNEGGSWGAWLALAFALSVVNVFLYESTIAVLAFSPIYILVRRLQNFAWPGKKFLWALGVGTALVVGVLFAVRAAFVPQAMPLTPPLTLVKNLVMYLGVLWLPVDLVWLHSVAGTPLPSNIQLTRGFWLGAAAAGLGCALVGRWIWTYARRAQQWRDWLLPAFWLIFIPLSLLPFLVFTDHASETYLYLPSALFALSFSSALARLVERPAAYLTIAAAWLGMFCVASWERNRRVQACAATAEAILHALPLEDWKQGSPDLVFAKDPATPYPQRYGIYNYGGIETIEVVGLGFPAMQEALRVGTGNELVRAQVLESLGEGQCGPRQRCFVVNAAGAVREVTPERKAVPQYAR